MSASPRRASRPPKASGLIIIIAMAMIFFTIIGLMILYWPDDRSSRNPGDNKLYVVALELRLQTQPNSKGAVVARAERGTVVQLVEADGPWARVTTPEGLTGWAVRNLLETESERVRRIERSETIRDLTPLAGEIEGNASLFAGPGIFYPEVGTIDRGEHVAVFTRDHDFFAIEVDGEIVYVEVDAVDLTGTRGASFRVAAAEEPESKEPSEELLPLEQESLLDRLGDLLGRSPDEEIEPDTTMPLSPDGVWPTVPSGGTEPKLIQRVTPRYSASARRSGIEGAVIIRAIVRKDGSVDDVRILKDLPMGLGIAAREAVERWRFEPATYKGEPIDVYYTVTVNYSLSRR